MGLKKIFLGLFAMAALSSAHGGLKIRNPNLKPMQLSAGGSFGLPARGWRKTQSVARHREVSRRQRRNAHQ